jgi:hypothetical protein
LRQIGFSVTLAPHLEGDDNFQRRICNRTEKSLLWLTISHRLIGSRLIRIAPARRAPQILAALPARGLWRRGYPTLPTATENLTLVLRKGIQ